MMIIPYSYDERSKSITRSNFWMKGEVKHRNIWISFWVFWIFSWIICQITKSANLILQSDYILHAEIPKKMQLSWIVLCVLNWEEGEVTFKPKPNFSPFFDQCFWKRICFYCLTRITLHVTQLVKLENSLK